jgi:hypothetical protein
VSNPQNYFIGWSLEELKTWLELARARLRQEAVLPPERRNREKIEHWREQRHAVSAAIKWMTQA